MREPGIRVDKKLGVAPRMMKCSLCNKDTGLALPQSNMPQTAYKEWLKAAEERMGSMIDPVPCEDCQRAAFPAYCAICGKVAAMLQDGCQAKLRDWTTGCKIVMDSCQKCSTARGMQWENVGIKCVPAPVQKED